MAAQAKMEGEVSLCAFKTQPCVTGIELIFSFELSHLHPKEEVFCRLG